MRKVIIYIVSLIIGLLLGILGYSLIRTYIPKGTDKTIDYILKNEVISVIEKYNLRYGININNDYKYDYFMENVIDSLDFYKYVTDSSPCAMYDCISSVNSIDIPIRDIEKAIEKIYGPDYKYELRDFNYIKDDTKGICTYYSKERVYNCTISEVLEVEEYNSPSIKFLKAVKNTNNDITVKAFVYYIKEYCDGTDNYCLFSDPYEKNLIVKCKHSELEDYLKYVNVIEMNFKLQSDNKYYLDYLKW